MKSKSFTLTEAKQDELSAAKSQALDAVADKYGYTPEQRDGAKTQLRTFMESWYSSGGQDANRRRFEAAWQRYRAGVPNDSDDDRAIALQKAYADMTWDERGMGDEPIPLIRGLGGEYAQRIAVADAMGEDWTANTWPLTSWAVPDANVSVANWVVDGVRLDSSGTTKDEVLAMYHSEPLLREKGLKVKGEYIVDGTGAIDSGDVEVSRLHGNPSPGVFGTANPIEEVIKRAQRFHDTTGGDAEDYWLGKVLDENVSAGAFGFSFKDENGEPRQDRWQLVGFDQPPESARANLVSYSDFEGTYDEKNRQANEANDKARYALAQDLKARGLTYSTISEMLDEWFLYQQRTHFVEDLKKKIALPIDPSAGYGDDAASSQEQHDMWVNELLPGYERQAADALDRLTQARTDAGITTPLPPV